MEDPSPGIVASAAVGALAERFLGLSVAERGEFLGSLGPDELVELDRDIDARVRSDLGDWCRLALGPLGQYPARHHLRLIAELEAIASGENDRLMVLMPPGSAKSTYVSDLFPAWFLASRGHQSVIAASHTSGLAQYFSKRVQGRIETHGGSLGISLVGEAVESWSTSNGGEYKAVGVGGAIAGRRADLMVIDDPIKSREEADNQLVRDRAWDWYRGDMIGRLKPTGRIVLVMCMAGATPVRMADGSSRPLQDIRPGDRVATWDNGRLSSSVVLAWKNQGEDDVFEIVTASGARVRANRRHPFLVKRGGAVEWVRLGDLRPGDKIVRAR